MVICVVSISACEKQSHQSPGLRWSLLGFQVNVCLWGVKGRWFSHYCVICIYSSQTDQSGASMCYYIRSHLLHVCGSHPWQLAHSSSRTDTNSRTVRVLSTAATISCPPPDHSAAPASAATSGRTTLASGPHHTPLSTGAMMHHTGEDIGGTSWGGKHKI